MEYPLDENLLRSMTFEHSEHGTVELVWMSPEEFLSKVPHPLRHLPCSMVRLNGVGWLMTRVLIVGGGPARNSGIVKNV